MKRPQAMGHCSSFWAVLAITSREKSFCISAMLHTLFWRVCIHLSPLNPPSSSAGCRCCQLHFMYKKMKPSFRLGKLFKAKQQVSDKGGLSSSLNCQVHVFPHTTPREFRSCCVQPFHQKEEKYGFRCFLSETPRLLNGRVVAETWDSFLSSALF